MGDKQITLFELHLHDAVQIGPSEFGVGEDDGLDLDLFDDDEEIGIGLSEDDIDLGPDDESGEDDADDGAGGPLRALLVGLVVAAAVAFALRRLTGEDED